MITGDSYGPIVGSLLSEIYKKDIEKGKIKIIGNLDDSVTYSTLKKVNFKYNYDDIIIVIDAALGNKKDIGKIIVSYGNIKIGSALYKNKKIKSDIKIKAIVAENKGRKLGNYINLKKVNKEDVVRMALKTVVKINNKFKDVNNEVV